MPNAIRWLLAALPILTVLVLMLRFHWGGARAGMAGWLAAQLLAALAFGADVRLLAIAQIKGAMLTLYVLYIIWGALTFFRVTDEAGAIKGIGAWLPRLTPDRGLQALILGWVFTSFLQGIGGYGVPVAVAAPLLVGLGFSPVTAVVVASIGVAWAVTFGSQGTSFFALMAASGRPGAELAPPAAGLLAAGCLACGAAALWVAGGSRLLRRAWAPLLAIGSTMAMVQWWVAVRGLWSLAAMIAALAGMAVALAWARWLKHASAAPPESISLHGGAGEASAPAAVGSPQADGAMPIGWALLPYALLVSIVLLASLATPIRAWLSQVVVRVPFPELRTAQGWITPAETGRSIDVFGHPGAIMLYAAAIAYALFHVRGNCGPASWRRILRNVVRSGWTSSLGIAALVGMSATMEHAGMTFALAGGIARVAGSAFPWVSPFIGVLGAFMTGSNTNSNVAFGHLQQQVALLTGVSPAIILAAQTAGASIGSSFAPAKIIVACSTVDLAGKESDALSATMRYGLVIVALLAILTALAVQLAGG